MFQEKDDDDDDDDDKSEALYGDDGSDEDREVRHSSNAYFLRARLCVRT